MKAFYLIAYINFFQQFEFIMTNGVKSEKTTH